jgi:hypothetical protein
VIIAAPSNRNSINMQALPTYTPSCSASTTYELKVTILIIVDASDHWQEPYTLG